MRLVDRLLRKLTPARLTFIRSAPSPQHAVDLFDDSWSSKLPLPGVVAGDAGLFTDNRIAWALDALNIERGSALELGPLEAAHSYMLEQRGFDVLAIEANARAFLKCLVVKEILGLKRCRFLLGDFVEFLRSSADRYDLCLVCGVLYHMINPVELIELVAQHTDRAVVWTHYRDSGRHHKMITTSKQFVHRGFAHTLYRYEYRRAVCWSGFCGGTSSYSHWLALEDVLGALRFFGLAEMRTAFHDVTHPNGPSICIVASRPGGAH